MICTGAEDRNLFSHPDLESVLIEPGMYRLDKQSTIVVECPVKEACAGNAIAGDLLCAKGHSGPMCQVCLTTDELTYVWSDRKCIPCEASDVGIMYSLLVAVLLVMILTAYSIVRYTDKAEENILKLNAKYERFSRQILTKYKIVVKLLQTLSKITTLYPDITFPAVFTRVFNKINIFVNLDVNILPFNCIASSTNFHHKLLVMTLTPVACIAYVGLVYVYQRRQIIGGNASDQGERLAKLEADCIYYTLVFVYTIFSLVSTTIVQTFNYDNRLEAETGESYLIADYSIQESDPVHRAYLAYAVIMFAVYCVGVPAASYYMLRRHKHEITRLQLCVFELAEKEDLERKMKNTVSKPARLSLVQEDTSSLREVRLESDLFADSVTPEHLQLQTVHAEIETLRETQEALLKESPMLRGLAPLYQDYKAHYHYFEVIQFIATLFLVAVAVFTALTPPPAMSFPTRCPSSQQRLLKSLHLFYAGISPCQLRLCHLFGQYP
jgi:hypothetical protein